MPALLVVLVGLLWLFFSVALADCPTWTKSYLGLTDKNEALKFLGISMGGVLLALQALIANRRAKAMESAAQEQAKANQNTEQGQRQERLKNAIEHLGHASDSVRLGGAYELFHLAKDTKGLRQTVLDILCAHIRQTTDKDEYQEEYKSKPSEEIQSLLTLLFVQEHEAFRGLHINLKGSGLQGANLQGAQLQRANLQGAQLQGACLIGAQLQGAVLGGVQLQGAGLGETWLQGAYLQVAQLQGISGSRFSFQFEEQIRGRIAQDSDLSGVIFEGGLSQEDVDSWVKDLSDEQAGGLRERLEPHIGKPESKQLPKDSLATTGAYTAEEAEQWIAEYNEAMSEIPTESDN